MKYTERQIHRDKIHFAWCQGVGVGERRNGEWLFNDFSFGATKRFRNQVEVQDGKCTKCRTLIRLKW